MTYAVASAVNLNEPQLLCWNCMFILGPLTSSRETAYSCQTCKAITSRKNGIWRTLSQYNIDRFNSFIADYEFIRSAEGRGSSDSVYYRALPFLDLTGRLTEQWKIRARTFQYFTEHILKPFAERCQRPLQILDLGAGNAWLSYRLSELGHLPVAIDLITNSQDGLAAAIHYPIRFPCVQAALDQLPFASASFDLAIFNASFHYSEDYRVTLAEAIRCTRPGGLVVIADSPWYSDELSGLQMVQEKHERFLQTFGFASNSISSQEFLTPRRLEALAADFNIKWEIYKPHYSLAWTLRPIRAKLKHQRTPSRFYLFAAEVPA